MKRCNDDGWMDEVAMMMVVRWSGREWKRMEWAGRVNKRDGEINRAGRGKWNGRAGRVLYIGSRRCVYLYIFYTHLYFIHLRGRNR